MLPVVEKHKYYYDANVQCVHVVNEVYMIGYNHIYQIKVILYKMFDVELVCLLSQKP